MTVPNTPGRRLRILMVEKGSVAGGSVISLYYLVKGLDRARFEPVVLLAQGNPYIERFRALGVEVLVRPWGNRPPQGSASVRAAAGTSAVRRLAHSSRGQGLYHNVGFLLKALPEILARARAFRRLVRKVRPDIVHLNDTLPINRGEVLGGWLVGVRMLIHARGFERLNALDRRLCPRVQTFVFISQALRDDFLGQCRKVRSQQVVYNGADPQELIATAEQAAAWRRELGLPPDARVATMMGRIVAWKGQHIFVEAMAQVARQCPDCYGVIVGAPDRSSAEYARSVETLVVREGLAERVRFSGFRPDVGAVIAGSDVIVHASVEPEPFGRVIIEGMAAGRPVIATRVGGVPELVEDGVSGLLVPPGDPAALASALRRVLEDRELAARLIEGGRKQVQDRFTIAAHVREMTRVYEAMIC